MNDDYYSNIPYYTIKSLRAYADERQPTGGFLYKALCNDFVGAALSADPDNARVLSSIAKYIYNEIPDDSWGSAEKVEAWLK